MNRNPKDDAINETKRLMGALGRMPPKKHEDMKIGKGRPKARRPKTQVEEKSK